MRSKFLKKLAQILLIVGFGIGLLVNVNTVYASASYEDDETGREIYVTNYKSFANAIAKVKEDDVIILKNNIATSKQIVLNKDITYTIDFNNKMYRYTGKKEAFVIKKGNVTLENAVLKSKNYLFLINTNGNLSISSGKYSGYICNKGYLQIDSGSFNNIGAKASKNDELIQNKGELIIDGGTYTNTVDNAVYNISGVVTIYGGKFVGKSQYSKKQNYPTILNMKKGEMVIEDAIVTGQAPAIDNAGNMTIENGSYNSSKGTGIENYGDLIINEGTVKSNSKFWGISNYSKLIINYVKTTTIASKGTTLTINDGAISANSNPAIYLASGKATINGAIISTKNSNTIITDKGTTLNLKGGQIVSKKSYAAISCEGRLNLYEGTVSCKNGYYPIIIKSGGTCKIMKNKSYFEKRISQD